jgi:hypothetical protein
MRRDSQLTGIEAGDFLELALRGVFLRRHGWDSMARFTGHGNGELIYFFLNLMSRTG